jgi:hypothetical protein
VAQGEGPEFKPQYCKKKLAIKLPYGLIIQLPGPRALKPESWKELCIPIIIAAQLTVPFTGKRVKQGDTYVQQNKLSLK